MRLFIIFGFSLLSIASFGQTGAAEKDVDYLYFVEKDEVGSHSKTYSCYLKNAGDSKLIFFNFQIKNDLQFEFVKSLPEDVIILDPHRTNKICKINVEGELPVISWESMFLHPYIGFSKYPQQEKHFVFYYEINEDKNLSVSYYIKNLSDRRLRFHDLVIENPDLVKIIKSLNEPFFYLDPLSKIEILKFESPSDLKFPGATWNTEFARFQPLKDEFSREFVKILEAAGEEDFSSVKGDLLGGYDDKYKCVVEVPGIDEKYLMFSESKWWYIGMAGKAADKKEIQNRLDQYTEKINACVPDVIVHETKRDKITKNRSTIFAGDLDGKLFGIVLKIETVNIGGDLYQLKILVMGAE